MRAFNVGAIDDWLSEAELSAVEVLLPDLREHLEREDDATLWHPFGRPATSFQPVVRLIEKLRLSEGFADNNMIGVEFWTQARHGLAPLYMHFDTSESLKQQNLTLAFPRFSTVLFFDDDSAPTLVVNNSLRHCRRHARATLCPRAMLETQLNNGGSLNTGTLVPPARGRLAWFDGDLLHGVLPRHPSSSRAPSSVRRTLLMNFWGIDPGIEEDGPEPTRTSTGIDDAPSGVDDADDAGSCAAVAMSDPLGPGSTGSTGSTGLEWSPWDHPQPRILQSEDLCDVVRLEVRLPLDSGESVGVVDTPMARVAATGVRRELLTFDMRGHPMEWTAAQQGLVLRTIRRAPMKADGGTYAQFPFVAEQCAGMVSR